MTEVATKDKAAQSLEDVRKRGEEALDHAKTAASDVLEAGKMRAEEEITHGKGFVARQVKDVAHAARTAADDLRSNDQAMMASWADAAAEGMSHVAEDLDGRDVHEIFGRIEDYARRQPAIFLAGVALAGFAAARFAKAARESGPSRPTGPTAPANPSAPTGPSAMTRPSYPEAKNV